MTRSAETAGRAEGAFSLAKRKAKFGHRDWIVYRDRNGNEHAEQYSASVVKKAMLAVGTQGRFHLIAASTGVDHIYRWPMACIALRNARFLAALAKTGGEK